MRNAVLGLIFALMLVSSAMAMTATARPAKMVLRANVTEGFKTLEESYFFVENKNNFSSNITIEPMQKLAGIIKLNETAFTLQPNETRQVGFVAELTEVGNFTGDINVMFKPVDNTTAETPLGVSIGMQIYTYEGKCLKCVPVGGAAFGYNTIIWVIVVVLAVCIVFLAYRKFMK